MSGLADFEQGTPERFVPEEMRGELVEAEHLGRYMLAAQLAPGRRVLDAGCGVGYGAALLARAGAESVVGVDVAAAVLDAVRPDMPDGVRLEVADLRELPFEDGSFDLVTCFEVVEHLTEPDPALDELVRVLAPDGVLLVSSPNRAVYPPGNPHHHHEYLPAELRAAVAARLPEVELLRQQAYVTAAILRDGAFRAGDGQPLDGLALRKLAAGEEDGETYTVAVAGRGPLPALDEVALLTADLEIRRWAGFLDEAQRELRAHGAHIHELEARLGVLGETQDALIEAEQRLAAVPELEDRVAQLEEDLRREREATAEALHRVERADGVLRDVLRSPSWRVTAPIRRSKDAVRGLLR